MDRLGVILLDLVSTRPSPSNGQTAKSLLASTSPQAAASEPPPGETLGTHTHSRLRGGGYGPHAALPQAQCSLPSFLVHSQYAFRRLPAVLRPVQGKYGWISFDSRKQ